MSGLPDEGDAAETTAASNAVQAAVADATARVSHEDDDSDDALIRQRLERSRRLKLSVILSLLIKPLAFLIPLVTVPLFLRYLGTEGFGLFAAVGALAMWVGMANVGLNVGLINQLTECSITDDRVSARRYVSTLTVSMVVMLFVGTAIFTAIVLMVDWPRELEVTDPVIRRQTSLAVWIAGMLTLLGMLSGIPSAIYAGYQETHRAVIWDGVAKIVTFVACLLAVLLPKSWGLFSVLMATSGAALLVRLVNTYDMFAREKPWLRPAVRLFDWPALRIMLHRGVHLFILSMAVVALFQSDKLIIAKYVGAAAVTGYEIVGRLFLSVYGVFALVLSPLWPAYGDAIRRGDMSWVRRQLKRTCLLGLTLMAGCGIVMLLFGEQVLQLWTRGAHVEVSRSLVLAITAMFLVRVWAESQSIVLNAANVLVPQVFMFGGHAVLNIIVAILVAPHWGVEGIAWSTSITGIVTSVWAYPWMLRKYLFHHSDEAPIAAAAGGT